MIDRALELSVKSALREQLAVRLATLGDEADGGAAEAAVGKLVADYLEESGVRLAVGEIADLTSSILDDYLRLGPLEPLLSEEGVSEIMVNGGGIRKDGSHLPPPVFVEKSGVVESRADVRFDDAAHVMRVISRIAQDCGRTFNESKPLLDAILPDGSRVNAVHPSISIDGPVLNIRRFRADVMSPRSIVDSGTCTADMMRFLRACVLARLNIIVSGGTGSGKTTLLNVLSRYIPAGERIVTIEDSAELKIDHENRVRLQSRPAGSEGGGAVTIHDLLVNALRERPDRIVVGECRSDETIEMLQAMQTGHDGSLTTIHANSPTSVFNRIETMCVTAQPSLTTEAVDRQIADAVDLIVHTARLSDGARKVTSIMSVEGYSDGRVVHNELFSFKREGVGGDGRVIGRFEACGMQPGPIREKILSAGAEYSAAWFYGEGEAL